MQRFVLHVATPTDGAAIRYRHQILHHIIIASRVDILLCAVGNFNRIRIHNILKARMTRLIRRMSANHVFAQIGETRIANAAFNAFVCLWQLVGMFRFHVTQHIVVIVVLLIAYGASLWHT